MHGIHALTVDDQDWLSISALAAERKVTRQAISERVKKLEVQYRLPTRGSAKAKRVHAPTFRRLVEEHHDPAQDLRLRHLKGEANPDILRVEAPAPSPAPIVETPRVEPVEPAAPAEKALRQPSAYDEASAREKAARADLAQMELARRRGDLVPAAEFEAAAVEVGTRVAQTINALRAKVTPFYAAAQKGEDALHAALHLAIDDALRQIADDMASIAARSVGAND